MTNRMSNVEMLMMLSDDIKLQGDELAAEVRQRGVAHAQRITELLGMVDRCKAMLERERHRFSVYLPNADEAAQQQRARISPLRKEGNG